MKNNIQKLFLIALTMMGLLTQVGCADFGSYETCLPDRYEPSNTIISAKFNNQPIVEGFDTFSSDFSFGVNAFDNGAVTGLSAGTYTIYGETGHNDNIATLENLPIENNDEKTFPVNAQVFGSYYSISNLSNGKIVSLPPTGSYEIYMGWEDDNNIHIQSNLVTVIDPAVLSLKFDIPENNDGIAVTHFPDLSPSGNLAVNKLNTTKTWAGHAKTKVLQNSNNAFHFLTVFTLKNGDDVFEQTFDYTYTLAKAECYRSVTN